MKMFFLIVVCVAAASVGISNCEEEKTECACPFIYWPVCGKDGKSYDNDCLMECAGTELASEGKCEGDDTSKRSTQSCPCPRNLAYVCGTDGNTYNNPCLMECAGVPFAYEGKCSRRRRDACNCPEQIEMPVCGKDGITYNSMCELGCAGTQFRFLGRCPATPAPATEAPAEEDDGEAVVCTADYTPVCGDDGVTYGNLCQLENTEGVNLDHDGECSEERRRRQAICTLDYTPVCGDDGETYGNMCQLENTEGVGLDHLGECGGDRRRREADVSGAKCSCPDQIDLPVCGKDGVTYNSMCALGCGGAEFRFLGHCPPTEAPETTTAAETTTAGGEEPVDEILPCVGDDCDDDE